MNRLRSIDGDTETQTIEEERLQRNWDVSVILFSSGLMNRVVKLSVVFFCKKLDYLLEDRQNQAYISIYYYSTLF